MKRKKSKSPERNFIDLPDTNCNACLNHLNFSVIEDFPPELLEVTTQRTMRKYTLLLGDHAALTLTPVTDKG